MAKSSDVPKFGVLNGLKIFSTGVVIAQPFAAALAADWGADVIHGESALVPDTVRAMGAAWSQERRNTRTIALNTPTPEGKEIFFKLCKWADIWMESSKPGQYTKWGLTDEIVWEKNPKLVIMHTSGYGQSGDPFYVSRASYDAIGQAFGGYMYINGMPPPNPPLRANPYTCDYVTAIFGLNACLAAYINASKTGKGDSIDCAQYEMMLRMECNYPVTYLMEGRQLERNGNDDPSFAGYTAYQCKDGEWVFVGIAGAGVFGRAVKLLGLEGDPDFPPGAVAAMRGTPAAEKLEKVLKEFTSSRTQAEVDKAFADAQVPCGPVLKYETMVKNPHYIAREDFIEWDDPTLPGGKGKGVAVLPKFKRNPGRVWRAGPTYGMDNEDILEELGYTKDQIKDLYDKRIIVKG